jgi:hypothetical protein
MMKNLSFSLIKLLSFFQNNFLKNYNINLSKKNLRLFFLDFPEFLRLLKRFLDFLEFLRLLKRFLFLLG